MFVPLPRGRVNVTLVCEAGFNLPRGFSRVEARRRLEPAPRKNGPESVFKGAVVAEA